jgi:hypothetical protein
MALVDVDKLSCRWKNQLGPPKFPFLRRAHRHLELGGSGCRPGRTPPAPELGELKGLRHPHVWRCNHVLVGKVCTINLSEKGNRVGLSLLGKSLAYLARPEARLLISSSLYSSPPPLAAQRLELHLLVDEAEMFQPGPTF